jgi:hypothetical protein
LTAFASLNWKIKREVSVLVRRAGYFFLLRPIEPIINRLYDRYSNSLVSVKSTFSIPTGARVAVYLLFQPRGLSSITLRTIERLNEVGFRVLLVSNAKLGHRDIDRLAVNRTGILQRPNYGLDFGGYRDGLLWIKQQAILPSEILLLNDSVSCLVADFEKFSGLIRNSADSVTGAVAMEVGHARERTLLSYFLLIKNPALKNEHFWNFWRDYQMANSRYATVRRGERGFSRMLREAEIPSGGFVQPEALSAEALMAVSYRELLLTLYYASFTEENLIRDRDRAINAAISGESLRGRRTLIDFIGKVVEQRPFVASFPYLLHHVFNLPVQKRGTTLLQKLAVCRFVDALDDGVAAIDDEEVLADLHALCKKHKRIPLVAHFYERLRQSLPLVF